MEYKLNKIDPELRRQINAAASSGKVHGANHDLNVNKDKEQKHEKNSFYPKMKNTKKIVINAVKNEVLDVEVFKENDEINTEPKGRFLDIRK